MKRVLLFLVILTIQAAYVFAGTKTWNNASGGDWNLAGNWTPVGVPTSATDTVFITLDGDYVVTIGNNITVSTIMIGASTGTQRLEWTNSSILTFNGTVTINSNGVVRLKSSGSLGGSGILTNNGTIWLDGGTISKPVINNDSILVTANSTISGNLTNSDSVFVTAGTLFLNNGGTSTNGHFVMSGGILQFNGGIYKQDAASSLTGTGAVKFTSGTDTLSGVYNITDSTTFNGANVTMNGTTPSFGSKISIFGGTISINSNNPIMTGTIIQTAGTINFNMADSIIVSTLNLSGGTLSGNSPMRIVNQFNWSGGTMSATDSTIATVIQSQALFNGGTHVFSKRTLINQGTITWTTGHWENYNGAIVQNNAGALIDAQNDYWFYYNGGTVTKFVNNGTLRKSGGAITTVIQIQSTHTNGLIQIQSGILQFSASASYANTDFTLSNHAILQFNGGTQQLDANSDITGTGAVRVYNGADTLRGIYNVSDSSYFIGGTTTFAGSPGTLQSLGAKLRMDGGTTDFSNGDSIIVATYWQKNGTLTGNSPMRITSECRWESGTIMATDSLVTLEVPPYALLTMNGGLLYLAKRTFNIYADMAWNAGWFRVYNGAIINNYGVWDHRVNNNIEWVGGSLPNFNNYATYIKSTNATNNFIDIGFNTTNGIVQVKKGTLNINNMSNFIRTRFIIDSSATLQWDGFGRTHTLDSLSSISGAGNMAFYGGTTNMKDTLNISGETFVWGGTANFIGPQETLKSLGKKFTLGNASAYFYGDTLKIDTLLTSGTLGGTSPIYVKSKLALSGGSITSTDSTVTVTIPVGAIFYWNGSGVFSRRTVNNFGTAIWTNPWGLDQNAVYNNMAGALTDWTVDGNSNWFAGTSNNFNNYGTLRKSGGTGTSSFEYYVNNYGLIEAQSGTILFFTGGTHAGGSFILSPGSTIDFSGGNHTFDASSSVTGTGTVLISPTTFTMKGIYNIAGSTTISGGTTNFDSTFRTTVRTTFTGGTTNFNAKPGYFLGLGNKMNLAGGTVNFLTTDSLVVDTLLVNGTLNGNNSWYVRKLLQLTAGNITSPDSSLSVTIPVGATFLWSGNGTIERRTIFNYGTATWSSPWGFSNSVVYNNMPGALTDLTTDYNSNWFFATTRPFFNNYGTLRKSVGTGVSSFEYSVNNYGLIEAQTGTIEFDDIGESVAGNYVISVGSKLWFAGGNHTVDAASTISGAGTVKFNNATTISGALDVGRLIIGDYQANSNGTLTLNHRGYADTLDMTGLLQGTDTLTIRKRLTWQKNAFTSGTMQGSGVTEVLDSLLITGSQDRTLSQRTLLARGPTLSTGTGNTNITNGATFSNYGVFDAKSDQQFLYQSGAQPNFTNFGTFKKSGGIGTTTFNNVNFNNYGILQIDSTLTFTQTGDTLRNLVPGSIQGKGTVNVSNGSTRFINDGHVRPGTSPGTLKIIGNYSQTGNAIYHAELGDKQSYTFDSLAISGTATLNGTLAISLLNGFVPAINDSFKVMSYTSRSGTFSNITGSNAGNGVALLPEYRGTQLVLYGTAYVNNNPVANNDSATTPEDIAVLIKPLKNDTDADGDTITINSVSTPPVHGNYTIIGDTVIQYTPAQDFNGIDSITYVIADGHLGNAAAKIYITVIPVNDPPVIVNALRDTSFNENFPKTFIRLLSNVFTDVDNSMSFSATNLSTGVTSFISSDSLYLLSTALFSGNVNIRVTAFDGQFTVADTFNVTVSAVNHAPFVVLPLRDTTLAEDFAKTFLSRLTQNFMDSDGDSLSFGTEILSGDVNVPAPNDSLFITGGINFNGVAVIRVFASDGQFAVSDTFIVNVTPVNDAPILSQPLPDFTLTKNFGSHVAGVMSNYFSDVDNALNYVSSNLDAGVTAVISNDTLYFFSTFNFFGTVRIKVTADDGEFSISDTLIVTVTSSNQAPQLVIAFRDTTLNEDFGRVYYTLLTSHFTDPDLDTLSFNVSSSSGNVIPSLQNDSLYLTGLANFNGTVTVYVGASDGSLSLQDTFLVQVTSQNDAPSSFALLLPAHNTLTNILRPAFKWNASHDIDGDSVYYLLEISTLQNFSTLFQSYVITDTFQTLTSDLDSVAIFYWRVKADDHKGGAFQSSSFTLNVDAKRPNVNISLLQGTVTKRYLNAYAYADENLSGAVNSSFTLQNISGALIDNRSAAMTKIGTSDFYTSSYHLPDAGNLEVQITAQDIAGNQRVATRNYSVNALSKGRPFTATFSNAEVRISRSTVSESGFIIMAAYERLETSLMPYMETGIELIGTSELNDPLDITLHYDARAVNSLKSGPDFDEKKIGIYRVTESGFEYVGGQGHSLSVSTTANSFGKYVALYNPNHTVVPDKVELFQNYPNPFNPTTTIQYGLVTAGRVKLVIYNILGQRVQELVDANQPAGYYKILWDGRNAAGQTVATGIYFYRLETPTGVLSRKMLLIK